jgi:hypothetical protein
MKIIKKYSVGLIIFVFAVLLLFDPVAWAQDFKKTATAGFTFLQVPATARTAALGESSIALSDMDAQGYFTNPAALGFTLKVHSLSISYAPWIADIKNYASSYAYNSPIGIFALGFQMMDYGSIPRTVVGGGQRVYEIVGTYDANSLALGLSYSKMLTDRFSFGVTFKYVQEKIYIYKASNILFDGGVLYYTGFGTLRIAAALQNFGTDAKFIADVFKMPTVLRLGTAAEVLGDLNSEYRVTLLAELLHPNNSDERINVGGEVAWNNTVILRGGYKFFYDEESFSLGIGLNPNLSVPLNIDFAYSDYGRLGDILRFSLSVGML